MTCRHAPCLRWHAGWRLTPCDGAVPRLVCAGAELKTVLDDTCTHLVHQGRVSDSVREVKRARALQCLIVAPSWIEATEQRGARMAESQFPPNVNPNLSLVGVSKQRTARSPKSGRVLPPGSPTGSPGGSEVEPGVVGQSHDDAAHCVSSGDIRSQEATASVGEGEGEGVRAAAAAADGGVESEVARDAFRDEPVDSPNNSQEFSAKLQATLAALKAAKPRKRPSRSSLASNSTPSDEAQGSTSGLGRRGSRTTR